MAKQQKKLGEILVEWQIISTREVAKALEHAKSKNLRIGEALIDLKLCNDTNIYKALAQQHNMEYIDLDKSAVPPNAVNLIPDDLMRKYLILPLGMESGKLRIAIHDPLDFEMLEVLRFRLNKDMRTVLAPKSRIKNILDELFNTSATNTIDKTMDRTINPSTGPSINPSTDLSINRWTKTSTMTAPSPTQPRPPSSSSCRR
jgi:type IV pilus assembly protein PilB